MEKTFASVDLGSNSFHLLIAQDDGRLRVVDKLHDRVRLAAGLTPELDLKPEVRARALDCLNTFGHRLARLEPKNVRAVGTNTLRKMRDAAQFLEDAQRALGYPIEIISGIEEARLVYGGVVNALPEIDEQRLVVDIGGGSTECILGRGVHITRADSLYMGCVEYTRRFFPDGQLTPERMDKAITSARLELGSVHRAYKKIGWKRAYGSSGTIKAVQEVLEGHHEERGLITAQGLQWLVDEIGRAGHVNRLNLTGLKPERAQVFAGGVCILHAIFRSLRVDTMEASSAALREGVVYELMGRESRGDIRDETVEGLCAQYSTDTEHAARVEELVLSMANQSLPTWELPVAQSLALLKWGARLHEIGKTISYTGYHKHGAYIIEHTDLPGFSRQLQRTLAALVLGQRRKFPLRDIRRLVGTRLRDTLLLAILLRLAIRLYRTRSRQKRPMPEVQVTERGIHLMFPKEWLSERPLTVADLKMEAARIKAAGYQLTWA